ncbi:hypothetical protein F4780DRAFT_442673 [Xylariomycetidae sp. FL0641]|nr:hypothetical protein F4780DRAFT_442673 [Xylariomycetidae sp. FL0641]
MRREAGWDFTSSARETRSRTDLAQWVKLPSRIPRRRWLCLLSLASTLSTLSPSCRMPRARASGRTLLVGASCPSTPSNPPGSAQLVTAVGMEKFETSNPYTTRCEVAPLDPQNGKQPNAASLSKLPSRLSNNKTGGGSLYSIASLSGLQSSCRRPDPVFRPPHPPVEAAKQSSGSSRDYLLPTLSSHPPRVHTATTPAPLIHPARNLSSCIFAPVSTFTYELFSAGVFPVDRIPFFNYNRASFLQLRHHCAIRTGTHPISHTPPDHRTRFHNR